MAKVKDQLLEEQHNKIVSIDELYQEYRNFNSPLPPTHLIDLETKES